MTGTGASLSHGHHRRPRSRRARRSRRWWPLAGWAQAVRPLSPGAPTPAPPERAGTTRGAERPRRRTLRVGRAPVRQGGKARDSAGPTRRRGAAPIRDDNHRPAAAGPNRDDGARPPASGPIGGIPGAPSCDEGNSPSLIVQVTLEVKLMVAPRRRCPEERRRGGRFSVRGVVGRRAGREGGVHAAPGRTRVPATRTGCGPPRGSASSACRRAAGSPPAHSSLPTGSTRTR